MSTKYNQTIQFPQDNYIIRCVDESYSPSKSSGNPMITLGFEVVSPDEVEVGSEKINVAGVKIDGYYTTRVYAQEDGETVIDHEKSDNCLKRIEELYRVFGLEWDKEQFNPENPVLGFKGRTVHALLYGKPQEKRRSPTAEQLKKRQKGDIILNPITKKPVITYQPTVDQIFGIAELV